MKHEVVLSDETDRNVRSIIAWYADRSQAAVDRWYREFTRAIASLADVPEQHPVARENDRFPIELRQLIFGCGRRKTHRIIYTARPDRVVIYALRHVAQQDWRPEEDVSSDP